MFVCLDVSYKTLTPFLLTTVFNWNTLFPVDNHMQLEKVDRVRVSKFHSALFVLLASCVLWFLPTVARAGANGSISGTVKDATGAAVPGATVTLTNAATGVRAALASDGNGYYSFPSVPVGAYFLEVIQSNFKPYKLTGIVIDANSVLLIDPVLAIGTKTDAVTVTENEIHVETASTQLGEVITGEKMTTVPLDGRSFTDLLSLQPGVAAESTITSSTVQDVGATAYAPSGDLNPGTISINGQREFANSFIVNGSDVEEDVNMGTAIVPNLDSIAEFRLLTSNYDAEYGEFSGGQVNVVTKSGANSFHGNAFEFLRNTNFDARNFFSPTRGRYDQNQFGGTFGGPIRKNTIFFFGDYQGTQLTQGVDSGQITVPSSQDRTGNLSDLVTPTSNPFTTVNAQGQTVPTTVSGSSFANLLSQKLGYPVSAGEAYFIPGCTSATCVLPNATIPRSAWSAPATNLLPYIPQPSNANGTFSTSLSNANLNDNKGAIRLDANTQGGVFTAYYFLDSFTQNNPYPTAQGGANVPGFNALNSGRAQLLDLGNTKTVSSTTVNEFHFSYLRDAVDLGKPQGGVGVSLASQGFVVGEGTPGIVPLSPSTEGVANIGFNNFTIGTNPNELKQHNNTYQALDNVSKAFGAHTVKFGAEFHYDQVNVDPIAQLNGGFLFFGSETGSDFADFLLGIPSQYNQSQLQPFYSRNKYVGLFAQDSWRIKSNLTLNYGLRWDRIEPWYEKYNQISTFVPGAQSVAFPGAPVGILFPTDPGVPRTLAPAGNRDFAPRIGIAYSPNAAGNGLLGKIFGGPGQTSFRASFGTFYTAIEALTLSVLSANAPYGTTYSSPAPPLFSTPFVTAASGQNLGQYFPVTLAPLNTTAKHPDPNVDWSQFIPISGIPAYPTTNRIPYTEEYSLSIERGIGANTVVSASYVGTQSHRQLVLVEANPGDPALCLLLNNPANLEAGQTPCGPFGESNTFVEASGNVVNGTRGPLGSNFGSDTNQATIGNANYNALELSVRHHSRSLEFFAGYTYSKSIDQSSNVGEEVNPFDPSLSRALSAFDMKHNFVVSYTYQLPVQRVLRAENRWTNGWALSGITRFSTGFPITLLNYGDNSLIGAEPNGINNYGVDEPDYSGGPLHVQTNPRKALADPGAPQPIFDVSQFSLNALGTPGTAKRRFFYGPGISNLDMALLKNVSLTESKSLQFRIEAFNVFNHGQFYGPLSVDGNIANLGTTFGDVISAAPPRLVQLGFKFNF
jgi:hypothetical protein